MNTQTFTWCITQVLQSNNSELRGHQTISTLQGDTFVKIHNSIYG